MNLRSAALAFVPLLPLGCYPFHPKPGLPAPTAVLERCEGVVVTQPQFDPIMVTAVIDGVAVRGDHSAVPTMTDSWLFADPDPDVSHEYTVVFDNLRDGSLSWRQVGTLPACREEMPLGPSDVVIDGPADA